MATPNDGKKLNFTFKVYDKTTSTYRPVYIAPDATDTVYGDVKLSDAINGEEDAKTGMTAATPLAVKTVQDDAVSQTRSTTQMINSRIEFNDDLSVAGGIFDVDATKGIVKVGGIANFDSSINVAEGITGTLTGNVYGNATSADQLSKTKNIVISNGKSGSLRIAYGSTETDFSADEYEIGLNNIDASTITKGKLPISVIPEGAIEKIVDYTDFEAAVSDYNTKVNAGQDAPYQVGDTIRLTDTSMMYVVKSIPPSTTDLSWCVEYFAGTAAKLSVDAGSSSVPVYFEDGVPVVCTSPLSLDTSGTAAKAKTMVNSSGTALTTQALQPIYFKDGVPEVLYTISVSNHGSSYTANRLAEGESTDASQTLVAAGSATKPVYFKNGLPVQCDDTLDITASSLSNPYVVVSESQPTNSNATIWITA